MNSFIPHRRPRRPQTGPNSFRPGSPLPKAQPSPSTPGRHSQNLGNAPQKPLPPPLAPEQRAALFNSPFAALGLSEALLRAAAEEQYETPTEVQQRVVPEALQGRDVLAGAQTGTGKTAAFVLPILQQLAASKPTGEIRALILTPTRELAAQIAERVQAYGRYLSLREAVIYGGVNQKRQEHALHARPDLLIATPGRLLDLMQQGYVKLQGIQHFVLDEADRMLDMGFIRDVRRITAALPKARQTLFFSATIPKDIEALAQSMLQNPVRVSVAPTVTTAQSVEQAVAFVEKANKRALLEKVLLNREVERAIVFTRTKHGASRLTEQLDRAGIDAAVIHGNKSQAARMRALDAFRSGTTRVLVATDVAARGIDVDGISHVINFDLPHVAEDYVHRIGRTGRAGASGRAISFCDTEERKLLENIERLIRQRLPVIANDTAAGQSPQAHSQPARPQPAARPQPTRHPQQKSNGTRHPGHPSTKTGPRPPRRPHSKPS